MAYGIVERTEAPTQLDPEHTKDHCRHEDGFLGETSPCASVDGTNLDLREPARHDPKRIVISGTRSRVTPDQATPG